MRAKPLLYVAAAAALLLGATSAAGADSTTAASIYTASSASNQPLNSNVLPVLVRVSKQGKITYLAPAYQLRAQYERLLRQSLAQMITQPAHNKGGEPIASELIMYVTGKTTKRDDGKYAFQFAYLSAKPVPFGNWIWGQFASGQLALLSPDLNYTTFRSFRGNGASNGACYYDRYYYSQCVIYTCVYYQTCKSTGNSDNTGTDNNDKPKATGSQIRTASTRVYRMYRPRLAPRITTHGIQVTRFQSPNAAQARRFQPVGPVMQQAPAVQNNAVAPMLRSGMGNGAQRNGPPEPALRRNH